MLKFSKSLFTSSIVHWRTFLCPDSLSEGLRILSMLRNSCLTTPFYSLEEKSEVFISKNTLSIPENAYFQTWWEFTCRFEPKSESVRVGFSNPYVINGLTDWNPNFVNQKSITQKLIDENTSLLSSCAWPVQKVRHNLLNYNEEFHFKALWIFCFIYKIL